LEAPSGLFTSQPHTTEYDFTIEDYEYIAGMIDIPIVVIVRSESPFKSLKDITEVAKEQPGGLICATTGSGGIPHLGMIHIAALSDNLENIIVVPTGGSALAVQQCLGGHVDFAVVHPSDILQHVEAGTIRPLAVLSEKRLEILPDVTTAVEEGFDDVVHSGWLFLLAHKDAPEEHLDKLKEVSKKVLHDEEFLEKAEKAGMTVNYRSPEENKKELERLYILYGELVKMIVVK